MQEKIIENLNVPQSKESPISGKFRQILSIKRSARNAAIGALSSFIVLAGSQGCGVKFESSGNPGGGGNGGEGGTGGTGGGVCVPEVAPPCEEPDLGVCAGATRECVDDGQGNMEWSECSYVNKPEYEPLEEESCDNLDNDCDNETDESSVNNHKEACPEPDYGVCAGATAARTCENGQWTQCQYELDPNYKPKGDCDDLLDNDCNGVPNDGCIIIDGGTCYGYYLYPAVGNDNIIVGSSSGNNHDCTPIPKTIKLPAVGNDLYIFLRDQSNVTIDYSLDPSVTLDCYGECSILGFNYPPDHTEVLPDKNRTFDNVLTETPAGQTIDYDHALICTNDGIKCIRTQ